MNENACLPLSMRLGMKHAANVFSTVHLLRGRENAFKIFAKASKITETQQCVRPFRFTVMHSLKVDNFKLSVLTK